MIKYDNIYRLSSALSRNQKKILKAFNMNNGSILMDAQYIAETLKSSPEDHPRSFECNLYWKLRNEEFILKISDNHKKTRTRISVEHVTKMRVLVLWLKSTDK